MAKTVTVHHFKVYDGRTDGHIIPLRKSTVERIERIPGAAIIKDTAEQVDPADLDDDGRYDPRKAERDQDANLQVDPPNRDS